MLFIKMRKHSVESFQDNISIFVCFSFKCYEIRDIDLNIEIVCIHPVLLINNNEILDLSLFIKIPNSMHMYVIIL